MDNQQTTAQQPAAGDAISPADFGGSTFTPAQLQQMAQWSIEDGHMTAEQAATALAVDGIGAADTLNAPKPAPTTPEASLYAGARPEEYQMAPLTTDGSEYGVNERVFDNMARGWLSEAGLPRGLGNALIAEVDKVSSKWLDMNDTQRQLYEREQQALLAQMWGENMPANIAKVQNLIEQVNSKQAGLADFLAITGASKSAAVMAWLAGHADTLAALREGQKP